MENRDSKAPSFCKLCEMLHSNLPPKTYHDLAHWWKDGGKCKEKGSFYWSSPKKSWTGEMVDKFKSNMFGVVTTP